MADDRERASQVGAPEPPPLSGALSEGSGEWPRSNEAGKERRGRKAPPEAPSTIPKAAKTFADKARDLESLRNTVVEAAGVGAGLWFSYIFVLLYLFIAVGSVTHKGLFLQSPIKLPFLNIELPLLGFFALGPLLFLIVHGYVLLHLVLLAGKVGAFQRQLKDQLNDQPKTRTALRRQLPSNLFVQILAGPREVRRGVVGALLQLVAWISLVIAPACLLTFFLLQFLPYHDEAISWWHRIAILADLVLLWLLWPSIALGRRVDRHQLRWLLRRRRRVQASVGASLVLLILVFTIATFPGEALHKLPSQRFIPTGGLYAFLWDLENANFKSVHDLLVAGKVDHAARKPRSLWSNRLVLPGFDVIDRTKFDTVAKIEALPETISLRKRNLEGAVLIGAKLRKADLTAANMKDAELRGIDLRGAKLECGNELKIARSFRAPRSMELRAGEPTFGTPKPDRPSSLLCEPRCRWTRSPGSRPWSERPCQKASCDGTRSHESTRRSHRIPHRPISLRWRKPGAISNPRRPIRTTS